MEPKLLVQDLTAPGNPCISKESKLNEWSWKKSSLTTRYLILNYVREFMSGSVVTVWF